MRGLFEDYSTSMGGYSSGSQPYRHGSAHENFLLAFCFLILYFPLNQYTTYI